MSIGMEYMKENKIVELEYEEAIEVSKKELLLMGINNPYDVYDNNIIYDNSIIPLNVELFDEFCDDMGFDTLEYFLFIAKRIELDYIDNQYDFDNL